LSESNPEAFDLPAGLIQHNVSLAAQCRFQVGGPADYFAAVSSPVELRFALDFAQQQGLRYFVYSGGSNLFFDSRGFRGLVIRMQGGAFHVHEREVPAALGQYSGRDSLWRGPRAEEVNTTALSQPRQGNGEGLAAASAPQTGFQRAFCVSVDSGYELSRLVRELARENLGGLEWLGNIPGSVGGAVVGNAGCYGHAIAEVLVSAQVYDIARHAALDVEPGFFEFAYRHSKLKHDPGYVVTAATLRLARRESEEILEEVEAELAERRRKHPHDAMCAGSFFKNPSREQPAWKLIGAAGLAGAQVGDAMLHPKHLNFLVNAGHAGSADIIALASQVQLAVREHCGLRLEPEVRYVGPDGLAPICGQ